MMNQVQDEEAVDTAPPEQAMTETKTMATVAGVTLDQTQLPLTVTFVASIVLIIALDAHYDWKNTVCNVHSIPILCVSLYLWYSS